MNSLLTVKDVAKILQVHTVTIRRYLNKGILKGIKVDSIKGKGRWRIPEESLQDIINKEKNNG
jgi:excisionase family DNA binding protein